MIFLIGYMGSGKTTFGKALSKMASKSFADLDEYIVKKKGMTIPEIFAEFGEEGFREIESESLREVAASGYDIVACGGGTPCFFDNMKIIEDAGVGVWLMAEPAKLFERLLLERNSRPLVAKLAHKDLLDKILNDLEKRAPHYRKAQIWWDATNLESEDQIKKNIEDFVSTYPELGFAITNPLH